MTAFWIQKRKGIPGRSGFSLVEMMIVVIIVGIMVTVATPPMFRYVQSTRLQTNTDRLAADLQYARSLSISRGQILVFASNAAGYALVDPSDGSVLRQQNFAHGMALGGGQVSNFYPWGMADARVFNISNAHGNRQITLLPTGIVEVD